MNYTEKQYWENKWRHKRYSVASNKDPIVELIETYIPSAEKTGEECYEIGCAPCGYLAYVGIKKHYIVNGIDYSDEIGERLLNWLRGLRLKVGEISKADFFTYSPTKRYKFVYSLGFIEHFDNFEEVLLMHDKYVEKNGFLLVTTPNYRGKFNYLWNKIFNPFTMAKHNINSMQPEVWASVLRLHGYKILWKGYFGGFSLWNDDPVKSRGFCKKICLEMICKIVKGNLRVKSTELYSPYCGIVARKVYE